MSGRSTHERGFTLIEVVVAMFILVFVVAAGSVLFTQGELSSSGTVTESQLIGVADQQLETIREEVKTQGFDALAMTSAPTPSTATPLLSDASVKIQSSPNYFLSTSTGCGSSAEGFAIEENYDNSLSGPASGVDGWSNCTDTSSFVAEPLEVLASGFVTPSQTVSIPNGPTVTVDTYVTDTYVGCANNSTYTSSCPTVNTSSGVVSGCTWPTTTTASTTCSDARRVIVAVVPPAPANGKFQIGGATPVYESTIFTSPTPSNAPGGTTGLTLGIQLG